MTTGRSFVRNAVIVRNADGSALLVEQALVSVRVHGSATAIPIYAAAAGGSPLTQPIRSDATGQISFWADLGSSQLFDALVSSDGSTVRAGTTRPVTFSPFTEALATPTGTNALTTVPMAAQPLLSLLSKGVDNASVLIVGDSTGDIGSGGGFGDATRWPAQWAPMIAAAWPAYTVTLNQWQDTHSSPAYAWPTPTVVQAGPSGLATHAGATGTTASNVILDPAATSADIGKRVVGLNIPPNAFIGSVVNGVSFTLVESKNSAAAAVYPWGNVSGVKIGADPVLSIWSASVQGSRWLSGFGVHMADQYTKVRPKLIIANHGHNENFIASSGAPQNGAEMFRQCYLDGVEMLTAVCPATPVLVTAQNPRTDSQALDAPPRAAIVSQIGADRGYETIDVFGAFTDYGDWQNDLMQYPPGTGAVHPNAAGSLIWAREVQRHFTVPVDRRAIPVMVPPSLFITAPAEQLAPGLLEYLSTGVPPLSWVLTNATVAVDSIGGVPCAKVISTGLPSSLAIPLPLAKCAGQTITATAWLQSASASTALSTGTIAIRWVDVNGNAHTEMSQQNGNAARDCWYFQSISKHIPADAQSVAIWLSGDQTGGTANPTWYRSVQVNRGRFPAGPIGSATLAALLPGGVTDQLVAVGATVQPSKVGVLSDYTVYVGPIFDGTVGNRFTTPDAAANRITGDIDLRAWIPAGTNCRPSGPETFGSKWGPTNYSWAMYLRADGTLGLSWHSTATPIVAAVSTAAVASVAATDLVVRAELTVNNAGQYRVRFYTSTDDGGSWSQLGATVNGVSGPTDIIDCAENVEIGSIQRGAGQIFHGTITRFEVRSTIGGAAVQQFKWPDPTAITYTASTGEVWTLVGAFRWLHRLLDPLVLPGVVVAAKGLGAGNASAATTPGTVTKKLPLYGLDGVTILGYVPVYDAIT